MKKIRMTCKALANKCGPSLFALVILLLLTLTGCGAIPKTSPAALPTVVLGNGDTQRMNATPIAYGTAEGTEAGTTPGAAPSQGNPAQVAASGVVVPAEEAQMAFALAGTAKTVEFAVGNQVTEGQVLVTLAGREKLAAAVESANLELLAAQQEYDDLFDHLEEAQLQALQTLNNARQAARDAEKRVSSIGGTADEADIDIARSQLIFAENDLKDAQEKYKRFQNLPENNLARARYRVVLAETQKKYDQALRKYNSLTGTTNDFDRQQAETELEIAKKQLELAQKDYDLLQEGPDPDLVKAAEARIKNAQAQLEASQAALADLELKAPFAGTVSQVNIHSGEWVIPGQPVLVLADLEALRIETTDLSERDIPKIEIGQPVTVFIKALNQDVTGQVSEISPLADTLGGDVVYKTTIDLDTLPPGLRAGMSVEVQFETGP